MRALVPLVFVGFLLSACGDREGTGSLVETKQGLFYVNLLGEIYHYEDGRFVRLQKAADASKSGNLLHFETTIESASLTVRGKVKLLGELALIDATVRPESQSADTSPETAGDNAAKIVQQLGKGEGPVTAITVHIVDADGFQLAASTFTMSSQEGWSYVVDESGRRVSLRLATRFVVDRRIERLAASATIGWRSSK